MKQITWQPIAAPVAYPSGYLKQPKGGLLVHTHFAVWRDVGVFGMSAVQPPWNSASVAERSDLRQQAEPTGKGGYNV
jgi:hypothetical protein